MRQPSVRPETPVANGELRPLAGLRDREPTAALRAVVEDLAGEFSLQPLLERILRRSTELLGTDAGSICLVDQSSGTYRKEADIGVSCQSGKVFPLDEGVTGSVVASGGPVIFDDYSKVPGGHVSEEDRATLRGVIGVPIRWRGEIVGACVVFSRDPERVFRAEDAEMLEVFANHAAIAITNARLHEAAEANAMAEAAAAERNRLAREVHDTVAQGLVSILLQLRSARSSLDGGRIVEVAGSIDEARAAAEAAFEETRRSVLGLAPSPLEGHSLEEALQLEIDWVNRTGVADVRLVTAGDPAPLPSEHALTLFRIAQESLTNALRHAGAGSVRVGVVYGAEETTLLVQDDGAGFDPSAIDGSEARHRLGLSGMTERATLAGGSLEVESTPGWGTRVRASIPLEHETSRSPIEAAPDIDVLVVDDHPMTRAGIVRALSAPGRGIRVVGEAGSGTQAVEVWRTLRPAVTLMDLQMPDEDGLGAITRIRAEEPEASIIALSAFANDDLVAGAMRAGARGFVGKEVTEDDLVRAVRAAWRGETVLSGAAADRLHAHLNGRSDGATLTERERQVLAMLERGMPDREIGDELGISFKTVEKHVGSILRKTGAHNRTHAAALARDGLSGGSR
ncbi:MAG TPA: response regulator [Actinomycetota bacterium]|nr:response regulator [Actinomycetota bacterium]